MSRIFSYIVHQGGVVDDSAYELAAAAKKIDPGQSPVAVLTGWGADLDSACDSLRTAYAEVWKVAHEALAYPNAEVSGDQSVRHECCTLSEWRHPLIRQAVLCHHDFEGDPLREGRGRFLGQFRLAPKDEGREDGSSSGL